MSALNYGLTPKMKPISPRRNALVAALDVGSSKVACLIARLRPHPPQQVLTRRSHSIEVVGYGHAAARGTKAGGVVNLAAGRRSHPPGGRRRRAHGVGRDRSPSFFPFPPDGFRANLFAAEIDIAGTAVSEGDIARVLAAGNRHSLREGRAVLHSLPIGYSIDGGNGIRDPRGMLGSRFGVDMHVATTDVAAARNLMLAVERCHLVVEAMAASPYVAGLSVLADDEADLGAAVVDMGAGTTTIGGVPRRPVRAFGRLRAGRPSRHHGHRARAQRQRRRCRANQDVLWQCAGRWIGRTRHDHRAAHQRR